LPSNPFKNCSYKEYLNKSTYKKLYDKVREIEDNEIIYKFIIICYYLYIYRERERERERERGAWEGEECGREDI